MLYQPSNISPDEISGTGCIDASKDLDVTWQVSGDSALTAYQIDIYTNDALSTFKLSTGKINVEPAFWGINYKGETQYFTASIGAAELLSAGIVNGAEYKLLITQFWNGGNIKQTTASIFITRNAPSIAINSFPAPIGQKDYEFTATYTQAQNDALRWVRWIIAEQGFEEEPFVDTGKIRGTGELKVSYDGFFPGVNYRIRCMISTENGIEADTGWTDFGVDYSIARPQGNVRVRQSITENSLFLSWDRMELAQGYSIFRQTEGQRTLHKIADADGTVGQLKDYSAKSGEKYKYYVFPTGAGKYLTEPMVSDAIKTSFWCWDIIEARPNPDGSYATIRQYIFRYGRGGVNEGKFSNNNSPSIAKNFTAYPTRMGESANYLTGSVGGLIGSLNEYGDEYSDTIAQSKALMELSLSQNAIFLSDPKGHFLRIATNSPVSLSIEHKSAQMTQTAQLGWVEIADAEHVGVYSAPGGDFYPSDAVFKTRMFVDAQSGSLIWEIPANYGRNSGSIMSLNEAGELIQTVDGAFVKGDMTLNRETMEVTAIIS